MTIFRPFAETAIGVRAGAAGAQQVVLTPHPPDEHPPKVVPPQLLPPVVQPPQDELTHPPQLPL